MSRAGRIMLYSESKDMTSKQESARVKNRRRSGGHGDEVSVPPDKDGPIAHPQVMDEQAPSLIWTMDLYLRTTYVSPSVKHILGYDVQDVLHISVQDFFSPESFRNLVSILAEEMALERRGVHDPNRSRRLKIQPVRKNGKRLSMEMTLTFTRNRQGMPRDILAYIQPVTRKKRDGLRDELHHRVAQRTNELRKTNEQLSQEIAERRGIEEAFRRSERRYRQIVENANDIIYETDADGYFTLLNPIALQVTGFAKEEILGRHYTTLVPADYRQRVESFYGMQFVTKVLNNYFELPIRTKNGALIWLGQNVHLLMEGDKICGFQSIARDITERKLAEEKLRDSEKRFRLLAEALPIGLAVISKNGRFHYFNPKFTEIFGYTLNDLPDKKAWFLKAHPDKTYRKSVQAVWNRELFAKGVDRGEIGPHVFTVQCQDKTEKIIHFRAMVMEDGGCILTYQDITAQARTEQALHASETRYRALFDAADLAIFLLQDGRCIECNRGAETMFAKKRDKLLGQTLHEFSPEKQPDGSHSRQATRRYFEAALTGKTQIFQWQFRRSGGFAFDAEVSLTSMEISGHMFIMAIVRDVTSRKKSEEALKQSEEKYRTIIENIEEGYYEVDKAGTILFLNDCACRILGYSRSELIGANYKKFTAKENHRQVFKIFSSVYATGKPAKLIGWEIIRTDGSRTHVEASVSLIKDSGGHAIGFRGICRDVTERKRKEAVLLKSERLKAVGELATGVAHNFNNLLQLVMGGAQLACMNLECGNVAEALKHMNQIRESSRFGSDMVTRLQNFARIRPDDAAGEVFDLSRTLSQAIEMSKVWWKSTAERKGIAVNLVQDLTPKCTIRGRESELFEVAVNLIKNGVEALPDGGELRITTSRVRDSVVLQVADNGLGIPREDLGKVFEPFYTTKGYLSTGMGLAGSFGIVSSHGGELSAESRQGEGATFTARLPYCKEEPQLPPEHKEGAANAKLTILVIDDAESVLKLIQEGLQAFGQHVLIATSGEQGIELFRNNVIDLVVCDLGMPDMNGWEVGKRIKAICDEKRTPKVPCILLTGWGGQLEEQAKVSESGFDRMVKKPVDLVNLLEAIKETLPEGDHGLQITRVPFCCAGENVSG